MAVSTITYSNKVALNENPSVADINKVKADDMNEIKTVVNNNATYISKNTTDIANITGTILWINPNPTSAFTAQTITLSSDDYDMYEILWYNSISNTILFNTGKIPIGIRTDLTFIYYSNNISLRKREISSITNSGITFGVAKENGATDNTTCIPLYVIGYKTGLFS